MRIGELSRRTGASPRSIRHYERAGLLSARRGPQGYREFDESAVERVAAIRTLLAHGFGVRDARPILSCIVARRTGAQPCAVALESYGRKLQELDARIRELVRVRDRARVGLARLRAAVR